ncbi:hypothetical protein ACOME3_001474 [Neoechinorhynchus agilis]
MDESIINELDSFMFQTVGHELIDLQAQAMDLPLFRAETEGNAINMEMSYSPNDEDEVEDLFKLLKTARTSGAQGVGVGAIMSDYQRNRVMNVCERLNLEMLSHIRFGWRIL